MKYSLYSLALTIFFLSCKGPIDKVIANNQMHYGKMLDDITRFDSVFIDQENNFNYCYSLENKYKLEDLKGAKFQSKLIEKMLGENLIPKVNLQNQEFKVLHQNKLNIRFIYNDIKNGKVLASLKFKITQDGYKLEREKSEWDDVVNLFYEKVILNKE
jgi:hypothetical protein